ncbi:MAG: tetratricopeptide repeat protein [Campylobacterales bacterium]|nr:tetratricopeptide repeat protein [Campylobacterales bacterium]
MRLRTYGFLICACTALLCAEPSMYGYDDSSEDNSYDDSQSLTVQNQNSVSALKQEIVRLNERVDGLTSIIEGLNAAMNELRENNMNSASQAGSASSDQNALLQQLASMIDKINSNYVTKEELQAALGKGGTYHPSAAVSNKTSLQTASQASQNLEGQSASELYSEGVRLFGKGQYDEAKKRFTITDTKGYKSAASNYYLGEIAYYTKHYEDAIFYFKKSAGLYDQASYIDTLLLHTGISLENTGDKAQAKAFYENIIQNYAGRKTAQIAQERLQKL